MSLRIEDGFNFAMGEWLAELTRVVGIGLIVVTVVGIVICSKIIISVWWNRRVKK